MDIRIKSYADNRDLKELKYIFVDALDVDPTFVRYEEEYNYCKSIPGLLEAHIELTPFRQDKNRWDEAYWTSLKMDLVKNFSDRRMMHMKEVAQVFLAEKITRILKERDAVVTPPSVPVPSDSRLENKSESVLTNTIPSGSRAEQEKQELEEARRKLEEENRRNEAARHAEARRIKQQRRIHQTSTRTTPSRVNIKCIHKGDLSKKAIGIAIAVLAVAAFVLILVRK